MVTKFSFKECSSRSEETKESMISAELDFNRTAQFKDKI